MGKNKKKIITLFCILTTVISYKTNAKNLNLNEIISQFEEFNISSNNQKYEKIIEEARQDKILSGYTIKKIKNSENNSEKQVITGKIELVPISEEHHDDWMRIMDCSDEKGREYLRWWTRNDLLDNEHMKLSFYSKIKLSKINDAGKTYPECANFMIKFYELEEFKTKKEIENKEIKFKEPKIVGFAGLSCSDENKKSEIKQGNFEVYYVVDKNFQGNGIATRALKLMEKLGSRLYQTGLFPYKSFVMYIACENKASIRIAEKCGFINKGSAPKELTNNLEAHMWIKKDNSNRILDYLLKNKREIKILNELNIKKSDIVISCHDNNNNKSRPKLIDFNSWEKNYANNKKFQNFSGFETIKKKIQELAKNKNILFHMKYAEWPVAWLKDKKFYMAIPDSLNEEIIKKVAHSFLGLKCNCDGLNILK